MTNPVLILRKEAVTARNPVAARTPDIAVVYATAEGQLDLLRPEVKDGRLQRMFSRYRTRYEIHLGDFRRTAQLRSSKLPAEGGIYDFETTLDVGFRVYDPLKVIERNVTDPLTVVYGHIIDVCRPIARRFRIDEFAEAEEAINQRFAFRGHEDGERLPEGILIYRCTARISADQRTLDYLRTVEDGSRNAHISTQQHGANVKGAHRKNEIDEIQHDGQLNRRAAERRAFGDQPLDIESLIKKHLELHPEDTVTAVRMWQDYQQARLAHSELEQERFADMFRFLADKGLVHAVDLEQLRQPAISAMGNPALQPGRQAQYPNVVNPAAMPVGQLAPTQNPPAPAMTAQGGGAPGATSGIAWDAPLPGSASTAPAAGVPVGPAQVVPAQVVPAHAVPVYLVVDTSTAVAGVADQLDAGLARLVDALAADPDRTSGVHLAIVGVAETATTVQGLGNVRSDTPRPHVHPAGALNYGAALEQVRDLTARDIPALKANQPKVRRPQVIMLVAGAPADQDTWLTAHQRLTDRQHNPFAPRVTAFGVGGSSADTISLLATTPDAAFAATTNDLGAAVTDFFTHTTTQLLAYAKAALDDQPEPAATVPPGFCVATSL